MADKIRMAQYGTRHGHAKGVLLAGGLTPINVESISHDSATLGVDVSSGVKDHAKIRAFIAAVRGARQSPPESDHCRSLSSTARHCGRRALPV